MIHIKDRLHQFLLQAEELGADSLRQAFASYGDLIAKEYRKDITAELIRCNLMHSIHPYEKEKYKIKDIPLDIAMLYLSRIQ